MSIKFANKVTITCCGGGGNKKTPLQRVKILASCQSTVIFTQTNKGSVK